MSAPAAPLSSRLRWLSISVASLALMATPRAFAGFSTAAGTTPGLPAPGAASRAVFGDFNNDGRVDVFYQTVGNGTAWAYGQGNANGTFTVYTSTNATGVFANATTTPFNGVTQFDFTGTGAILTAGDFNGDGRTDIWFTINGSSGTVLWNGASGFTSAAGSTYNFPAVGATSRLVAGDFNNDGVTDLFYQTVGNGTAWAYAKGNVGGTFTVYTSTNATGAFANATSTPFNGLTQFDFTGTGSLLRAGDFNGDGKTDIWWHVNSAAGTVLWGGASSFTSATASTYNFPAVGATSRLVAGDFDSDGIDDLFYQTVGNGTAWGYAKGNSNGTFTVTTTASLPGTPFAGVTQFDFTGTGAILYKGDVSGDLDDDFWFLINGSAGTLFTQNGSPPLISSTTPADNAVNISLTTTIALTFDQTVAKGSTGNITIKKTSDNSTVATIAVTSGSVTGSGATWTVATGVTLATSTSYYVQIAAGAFVNTNGQYHTGIASTTALNFTTVPPPPVINSTLTSSGTYRSAISTYTITATNSPTSYSASGLPTGVSVNTSTGQITGTPTQSGTFNVTIGATNAGGLGTATLVMTIAKVGLTVTGITASNKVYNANTTATLNTGSATLVGVISGDTVTLGTGSAAGAFATKTVGTGKTVTVSGLTISGGSSANYALTQPTTTANITAAGLTVTGITASNKVYNTTTAATLNVGSAALSGVLGSDAVTLGTGSAAGAFATKTIGTGKTVTVSGLTISGADSGNYTLTQPTTTANITAAGLTVTGITASSKVYDATTAATLNVGGAALVGVLSGDTVTLGTGSAAGAFTTKTVGTGKTVTVSGLTISGADSGNYTLTQPTTTADITAAGLTVTGITASNKVYNTTTAATLNVGGATLVGVLSGDTVTLGTGSAAGAFATKTVGTGKTVTVSGLSISGADSGNYTLTQPTTTADITAVGLTVTGITASNKVYDATTTATLNVGGATLVGVLSGDTVTLGTGSAAGAFATKTVGTGKTVTVSGLSISGADSGNYALTQPTTTADITAAGLTVTGITASNKAYDTTTAATLNVGGAALVGVLSGDTVTLGTGSAAGAFATKTVGTGKTVTVSGLTISGADSGNYTLTQPTTTANITAGGLTVTGITADDKVYDATTTATLNTGSAALSGVDSGDTVTLDVSGASGTFATKTIGSGKTVTVSGLTIGGADAGNYTLTQPTTTASITAVGLTVTGITANNKVYDATTAATLDTGSAVLHGIVSGDSVTLDATSASATFDTKNVGTGKTVTVTGLSLGGTDAGNYTLTQPTATANVTTKTLTVTADDKSRAYGSANPALTATITGFAGSETASALTGTASVTTAATAASSPGTYSIVAALGTLAAVPANYTFSFVDGTLTVASLTYADWKTQVFTAGEQADSAISGPDADPDGDGTINLLEYAFALDPMVSDRTALPTIGTLVDGGSTYAAITYPRRLGTSDLLYDVQASANLSTWNTTGVVETGSSDLGTTESATARDGSALGTGSRRFLRVLVTSTSASQPAASDPLGAVAMTVQGAGTAPNGRLNLLGLPLTEPVVYQGKVSSVSGSTLVQSGATWSDDAFNGAAGTYFVEIASGANAGLMLDVVATSASAHSLTLGSSVAAYASAGDVFKVRRHWTLADVFGAANAAGLIAGSSTTADLVQVYVPSTQTYTSYYYKNTGSGGTGWRSDASLSVDAAATPLYFDEGFLLRKQTASLTWILTGAVKTGPTILAVAPGTNFLPNVYPAGTLTLSGSQIYTGSATTGLAGGSLTTADLVNVHNPATGTYTNYYYKTIGVVGGTGWRANTSLSADASSTALPIGGSVLLQRKAAGTFLWHVPQPF